MGLFAVAGPDDGRFEFRGVPVTDPGPGEARVRVRASGLNRGVLLVMAVLRGDPTDRAPIPAEVKFAGEVDALGDGVEGVSVGDRVMGRGEAGTAEFVTLDAGFLVPVPDGCRGRVQPQSPTCSSRVTTRALPTLGSGQGSS